MKNTGENCEMIWKIWKKLMKRYTKYGRNQSWIVVRYEKYKRKARWIVKRFGKYRRKLWNDMENIEEK